MAVLDMFGLNRWNEKYVVERRKLLMDHRYPRAGGKKYSGPGIRKAFEEQRLEDMKMWPRDCYTDLFVC